MICAADGDNLASADSTNLLAFLGTVGVGKYATGEHGGDVVYAAGDFCGQGYMNIEYSINDLTVEPFSSGVVERSPEKKTAAGDVNADGTYSIADV